MQILVAMPEGDRRESFFPRELVDRVESLGDVRWNESDEQFTPAELSDALRGTDVVVTGWGVAQFTADVLEPADELDLVVHTGGSVARVASDALYERDVTICSANRPMAGFVAELVIGEIVCELRDVFALGREMRNGEWRPGEESGRTARRVDSLHGTSIGLVGLGTVGGHLLDHLSSFDVEVRIYDPYLDEERIADYGFATVTTLDDALAASDVVSVHASKTEETIGMIGEEELATLPDGCLFVNTARAAIVDEAALVAELRSGRISACLDVFWEEPLPADHELRDLDNVVLTPHVGGSMVRPPLTEAMLSEVERYADGEPLEHAIPREQYELMT